MKKYFKNIANKYEKKALYKKNKNPFGYYFFKIFNIHFIQYIYIVKELH